MPKSFLMLRLARVIASFEQNMITVLSETTHV